MHEPVASRLFSASALALGLSLVIHGALPVAWHPAVEVPPDRVQVALQLITPESVPLEDVPPEEELGARLEPEEEELRLPPPLEEGPEHAPGEAGAAGMQQPEDEAADMADEPLPAQEAPAAPEAPEEVEAVVEQPPEEAAPPPPAEPPPEAVPEKVTPEAPERDRLIRAERHVIDRHRLVELARHRAERRKRLEERRARLAALAQEREARRGQGKGDRGPGQKAGGQKVIPPELKEGDATEVWGCEADSRGVKADVLDEEPLGAWVSLVPTVMFTFPTEPGLTGWMDGLTRVKKRKTRRYVKRAGPVEIAIPAEPITVAFEEPLGVKATLGRRDARCLVGFRWNGKDVWPLTVYRIPALVEDGSGHSFTALVDVTFYEDARFEISPHGDGAELPIQKGRLDGGDHIERAIASHVSMAKTAQEVASWFGLDLRDLTRKKPQAKAPTRRTGSKRERVNLAQERSNRLAPKR